MAHNLLFITADQWRGDCLSSMAHPVIQTPHLDALAADGTLFERHFANAVPCGPSRACLHTGMYLHNHRSGTNGTPLDARFDNWALRLRTRGYDPVLFGYTHTAPDPRMIATGDPRLETDAGVLPGIRAIVDMATHCGPWRESLEGHGYALPANHGATYGERHDAQPDPKIPRALRFAAEHSDTYFLVDSALRYIEQSEEPWAIHLSLRAPHPPWVAPAPYHARYPIDAFPELVRHADPDVEGALHPWLDMQLNQGRNRSHADPLRHRLLQAGYYGLMSEVDDNMGRLIAALKDSGSYDKTLIIFTSDHGEQMGDHWLYGKSGFFDQSYHIPLIVKVPQGPPGQRVEAFTEHVDIMPTLLEQLGAEVPRQCDGRSLGPFLHAQPPANWRDAAHWEYDFRAPDVEAALGLSQEHCTLNVLRDARTKYVHFAGLPPLLFDLESDPQELHDRASDPGFFARRVECGERLLSWRMQHADKTLSHIRVTREEGLTVRA
jgi:arylsulfatase A-like enzyme